MHTKYHFQSPMVEPGGLEEPTIADYEISKAKALSIEVKDDTGTEIHCRIPHSVQKDRYLPIRRPWSFIDPDYKIINPDADHQGLMIEDMPAKYSNTFKTVIMVSVFEHINNPYQVSDCLFAILQPGGYLFNSTPFLFPYHPAPEDNWRFSPLALKRIHQQSGFKWLEGDFHVNYSTRDAIGDPTTLGMPHAVIASYALCQKP